MSSAARRAGRLLVAAVPALLVAAVPALPRLVAAFDRRPGRPRRKSGAPPALLAPSVAALLLGACQEQLPTASRDDLVPAGTTVEVVLPFQEFGKDAKVFGGYGRASDLGGGFVALDYGSEIPGEGLAAATLARFGRYPRYVSVTDTTGTTRPDSSISFLSGRVVVRFNADGSVTQGAVEVLAHAVTQPWDHGSADWEHAVDSLNERTPWFAPGGAGGEEIGAVTWDPAAGDSVEFVVDSARVAAWADSTDVSKGVRFSTTAPGVRLQVRSARLWLEALPTINPDTLVQVLAVTEGTTFIYDPQPAPPAAGLRVGGAPAWRSVLELEVPAALDGLPELCTVVACPVAVGEGHVSYAGLVLTSRQSAPAFAPSDTLTLDVRMVLAPEVLPKSPLGPSTTGVPGALLSPEWFSFPAGAQVEVPVTTLIRDILRGETENGEPVTSTVALLSTFEPVSLEYASFEGPGSSSPPGLRLILSFSPGEGGG